MGLGVLLEELGGKNGIAAEELANIQIRQFAEGAMGRANYQPISGCGRHRQADGGRTVASMQKKQHPLPSALEAQPGAFHRPHHQWPSVGTRCE